ncbi:uncharacterized protein TNCV_2914771 [Trichonephila clavipes]|nr:uncharacterized protein TNCV_2914771 [Trichonephila clavipes]
MSFSLYIKSKYGDYKPPITYRGPNATKVFYDTVKPGAVGIKKIFDKKHPIKMKAEDERHFQRTDRCHICELNIKEVPSPYSHPDNLTLKKELGGDDGNIDVIPNNEEKYISFSKEVGAKMVDVKERKQVKISGIKLRFLDSFKFMASSLDNLAKNVKEFRETSNYFPKDKLNLVTRKGVYPYDYLDSWQKCEYSDLYVKTVILILADIIEHFRDVCLKTYKLDPAWYFTASGLSWDAMLKPTKIELEMLDDYNMGSKDVTKISDDSDKGYIIECDLQYPEYLHNLHSDLPLGAENRIPDGSKQAKLLTTLHDKEHYVVHYRVLKQFLQMGLKLTKVHRVLESISLVEEIYRFKHSNENQSN